MSTETTSDIGPQEDRDNESVATPDMLDDPEIELITDYLMKQLPPDQVAEVERRLEEDQAFRELAAPLLLAWSIPPRWKREPMPRAELEEMWQDFRRRFGIGAG